jgi:hypothetical protein
LFVHPIIYSLNLSNIFFHDNARRKRENHKIFMH